MNKEHVYGIVTTDQGLPSSRIRFGRSRRGSMGDRVTDLLRAIWIAAVAFFGAGLLGILPAFGQQAQGSFSYDFRSPGTGKVLSGPTLGFSPVTLHNVSQADTPYFPVFGPFPNGDPNHFISFRVFAPARYVVAVDRSSLSVSAPQAFAVFTVSPSDTSQEIQVRFEHNPAVSDMIPIFGGLTGNFTIQRLYSLTVNNGSGTGNYLEGKLVKVTADPPPAGQEFASWTGDIAILSNPFLATTTAIIAAMDVNIAATYSNLPTYTVAVTNGTSSGDYPAGARVSITADAPPAGQQFAGWTGNVTFANVSSPTTTFTMPSSAVAVTATYSGMSANDMVRYYPRQGATAKMIGGVFEGTNGDPVAGPYTEIHTITTNPPPSWSSVNADLGDYRYLRYRAPNGSYGNVAEIEFYRAGVKLTGTGFGTPGSWNNVGNTFAKALDGNVQTYFDGPVSDGNFVGIDTGNGASSMVRYYPRQGATAKMIGGVFEGTNGDPVAGPYTEIHTITTNPPPSWSSVNADLGDYRYLRYRAPNGSYGNVAEIEFYRAGVKLTGTGFGTPGSWNNVGNTFAKALDGDVQTYFDGPVSDGNFVGIDTGNGASSMVRYYPRQGATAKMIGGVFEGTNGDPVAGPYTEIHTITTNPPPSWSSVNADLRDYRYLRYRAPNGSYGNVAEIEFYRAGVKLTGTGFGTPGSWNNVGNTFAKALDGDVQTYFDGPVSDGNFVGIDIGDAAPGTGLRGE